MPRYSNPLNITSKPLAMEGLLSYRCKGVFGWIMIGAKDHDDAMIQARRSSAQAQRESLQIWDGRAYVTCSNPNVREG